MTSAGINTERELLHVGDGEILLSDDVLSPLEDLRDNGPSLLDPEIQNQKYREVFLSLFSRSGIGLAILDSTLRVRSVISASSDSECDRSLDDLRDRSFAELLHPSVRQYTVRLLARLVRGRRTSMVTRPVALWLENAAVPGKLTAFPVEDDTGEVKMILVQFAPDEPAMGQAALDGSRWKLAPLSAKVLEGVAAGCPTARLAANLFLSRQGIEYHVGMLLKQFDVPNRTALAAKAYSMGMFSIGLWPPKLLPEYIRADH